MYSFKHSNVGGLASIKGKVGNYPKGRFPINCRSKESAKQAGVRLDSLIAKASPVRRKAVGSKTVL